jgi:Ca-activated chloride channel family protein
MDRRRNIVATISGLLLASVCLAADRVEIIVDNSAAMWGAAGRDVPRFVSLREALAEFAIVTSARDDGLEIGVRLVGGGREMTEDGVCDDTELLLPVDQVEANEWRDALADLFPRGGRPLVQAVRAAVDDLSNGGGRIVIVAAADDTCLGGLAPFLSELIENQDAITFRVVGMSMDRATADSLTSITRTRNATTEAALLPSLSWAALPSESRAAIPQGLSIQVSRKGSPVSGAEISLVRGIPDEEWTAPIEDGATQLQLPAGRYRGTITSPDFKPVEVSGIDHGEVEGAINLDLSAIPSVTLDVAPEHPAAGDHAYIQFWGAPDDSDWVTVAVAGTPLGSYLVRSPTTGRSGNVILRMPDTMREFEARFVNQSDQGVLQILGRRVFQSSQSRVSIDTPEKQENGTPLQISWQGPNLTGDHITIKGGDDDAVGDEVCILATSGGPVTTTAPMVPGTYEIRYVTGLGRTLARANLDIYEVLATLRTPTELRPGEEFAIEWTGPNDPQDYLSISLPESENEAYIDWQPVESGNPLHLRSPQDPGEYEIRYVRSSDGALLAREPLAVTAVEVSLRFPPVVEVGTRFDVEWSGTPGRGDFLAVASEGSEKRRYLDWSYTTLGNPLSLAAPFKPGKFEVLYISGEDQEVVVRAPLKVRR